jgi:S1-C subfamily serine protease
VILCASVGQALLQYAGARMRDRITWQPVRAIDAVGGALLSGGRAAGGVGARRRGLRLGDRRVTPMVRDSAVLAEGRRRAPGRPRPGAPGLQRRRRHQLLPALPRAVRPRADRRGRPRTAAALQDPDVENAADSVLKVRGTNDCGRGVEGTGFLYADDRLMTNAHVVAGVDDPEVLVGDDFVDADVVYYNPDIDVAVLAFDSGGLPRLDFDRGAGERDGVAILGYPQDGPYDVQPGRIRAEQRLRSPDIYGDGTVIRRCTPCAAWSGPATPAARSSPRPVTWSA